MVNKIVEQVQRGDECVHRRLLVVQDAVTTAHIVDPGGDSHITFQYEKPLPGLL